MRRPGTRGHLSPLPKKIKNPALRICNLIFDETLKRKKNQKTRQKPHACRVIDENVTFRCRFECEEKKEPSEIGRVCE